MPTPIIEDSSSTIRLRLAGLIAVCLLLFFFCLGSNRALTYHEVLMASTAKQMVQSGNWIVPSIGDHTWLEKPPLPQWLAAICALVGGFNEWTMRLPFAIAAVVVVLLTVRLMTRLFDSRIGWLSGVVQASTVYMVMYARLAEADMLLLAFVLGAITLFQEVETQYLTLNLTQLHRRRLAFWLLIGLTNLAKGVAFGAVLVLFTCGGWLLLNRDWRAIRRWWSPLGIVLALGIALAWPLAVALYEPAAVELWKRHFFGRAAGTLGYTQPVWYYLAQWPLQLMPWTPFFLLAVPASLAKARRESGSDRFCWWWFTGQLALLSCSSGKHHHYLIYALPALSPVVAQGLVKCAKWLRDPAVNLKPLTLGIGGIAASSLIAGIVFGSLRTEGRLEGWMLAPAVCAGLAVLTWNLGRRQTVYSAATFLGLVLLGHVYAQLVVMPRVDASAADKQFLAEVEGTVGPDQTLAACGNQEIAQHLFYLKRPVVGVWDPATLPQVASPSGQIYVIARGYAQTELATLGQVDKILQSTFTRREKSPQDRFTLFRIELPEQGPTRLVSAGDDDGRRQR